MSLTQDLETLAGQAEIAVLESWLDHELYCQSKHSPSSRGDSDAGCSILATHQLRSGCGASPVFICESRATFYIAQMSRGVRCATCKHLASECWKIIPI